MTAPARETTVEERVRQQIERTIQRSIKGLEYISTGDPAVGLTPKEVIHARGTLKLYHYRPQSDEVYRVPVMLVMSLVSKPYILDLTPGQSLVEFLLKKGFDVYMIDWGVPRPEDTKLRLEDYVLDFIPDCAERVMRDSEEDDVSVIGYCMGGQLATMYGALHADGPMKNLACFTTPVDADGMTLFKQWTDRRYFDVDRVVDTLGNVPPELLFASFDMLKPAARVAKNVQLWDNLWNDEFVKSYRMFDRWAADQIPFPGECFRQVTKEFMWENKFAKNELEIGGRRVDLGKIKAPFIHIVAEHDHIVPYEAAKPLVPMIGSEDKREVMLKGGHVSLVAGGNAIYRLWPQLESWLGGAFGMTEAAPRKYPITYRAGSHEITLRQMTPGDKAGLLEFARALPEHDLLFLRRDISQEPAIDDWISELKSGEIVTILAVEGGRIVGYATIHRSLLRWTAHVAELRVMVAESARGLGLGRVLTQEAFANALAMGIEKMVAQMTLDQKGAIATFEGLGFRPEALLRDQVKDRAGNTHDLLVLSHEVAKFESQRAAYGVSQAFGF